MSYIFPRSSRQPCKTMIAQDFESQIKITFLNFHPVFKLPFFSSMFPNIIPEKLQHVLWVDTYPLRGIDQLIARKNTHLAELVTKNLGLEFRYVLLRMLEHHNSLPEIIKKDWEPFDFLPAISLHESRCICSHKIKELCFITHIPTNLVFLVGNCCVEKIIEFDDIARHNNSLINARKKNERAAKKAEEKAEDQRKLIEEAANKAAKKAEDEAEEQRIAIQKINDILKCCSHDTFANSVKQQVVAGSKVSSKQMVVLEKIYVNKKVKATLDLW